MAGQAPIIALLMISGLWIVSAGDFGDKYTELTHGALYYTCVYFKQLGYDGVETQKNLCEIVNEIKPNEIKFNTSSKDEKIQTEEPDSFDGPNLVDTLNSDKLMDWCFFNQPDGEVGKQTQADACQKLIEIVKPYKEEDVKGDIVYGENYNYYILESLAVEGEEELEEEDITEEANAYFMSIQKTKEKAIPVSKKISSFSLLHKDDKVVPSISNIIELQESRARFATEIHVLNQDLQKSGLELANQVKTYLNDLAHLKKKLNAEMDQLKTDYQDLINTLQQQENDFSASLRYLGMGHVSRDLNEIKMSADWNRNIGN